MVWTRTVFQERTNLGLLDSRNNARLLAIDTALDAYHAADPARKRGALIELQTKIDVWLESKKNKKKSSRRASVNTLRLQVEQQLEELRLEALARQREEERRILEQSKPRLVVGESGHEYYTPLTGERVRAKPADWELLTDRDSGHRYYWNKVLEQSTDWVEPDHWDDQVDDETNRVFYWNRKTEDSQWEVPVELTEERIRELQLKHFLNRTCWVPSDFYTIESETLRKDLMVPYRKTMSQKNTDKEVLASKVRKVKQGDTLHLTIREDVQHGRLTVGPYSARGRKKIDFPTIDAWEGARINNTRNRAVAQQTAKRACLIARALLPLGAFNNRGGVVPAPATWSADPGTDMSILDGLASRLFGESTDFLHALAANAAAVRQVGGGVCSMITALTAGILTMIAEPETEIIAGSCDVDHTYCVISHKKCNWVCADPWPLVSYPCRWNGSYFGLQGGIRLDYYLHINIHKPVRIPFGVYGTTAGSLNPVRVGEEASLVERIRGTIGSPYGHLSNAPNADDDGRPYAPHRFDDVEAAVKQLDWGPAVDLSHAYPSLGAL